MASSARIDELKKKFDDNPRRYFAPLANEFRKVGDVEQAILICEEFLPQQPGHMSGHIVYGQALFEAGRMPESRTVFETALSLDPENLIALRHLGDIAREQDDVGAARSWYARVLDADPRNEEIQGLIASLGDAGMAGAPAPAPSTMGSEPAIVDTGRIELSLDDTLPAGMPAVPESSDSRLMFDRPNLQDAPSLDAPTEPMEAFTLEGLEATEHSGDGGHVMARAEGLEPAEFSAPESHVPTTMDLDDSLESGVPSFDAPSAGMARIDGLEGSGVDSADASTDHARMQPLDIGGGLIPVSDEAPLQPPQQPVAMELDEFSIITSADLERVVEETESAPVMDALPDFEMPDETTAIETFAPAVEEVPAELPAAVLAAEAALIDAEELEEGQMTGSAPFVTETMADLYLAQGFRDQALAVYGQLLQASPSDERLRARVASLNEQAPAIDEGPSAREFLSRFAGKRPGARAAAAAPPSQDDFAAELTDSDPAAAPEFAVSDHWDRESAVVAPEPAPAYEHAMELEPAKGAGDGDDVGDLVGHAEEPAPIMAPVMVETDRQVEVQASQVDTPARPDGTIDALFGNRAGHASEDSAASALAQAFGNGAADALPMAGKPARAAAGELSLDSVFRGGSGRPPRSSQSFSFDQFFSEGATTPGERTESSPSEQAATGEPPAERSADDVQQFNSWLQGLKQR